MGSWLTYFETEGVRDKTHIAIDETLGQCHTLGLGMAEGTGNWKTMGILGIKTSSLLRMTASKTSDNDVLSTTG